MSGGEPQKEDNDGGAGRPPLAIQECLHPREGGAGQGDAQHKGIGKEIEAQGQGGPVQVQLLGRPCY